MFWLYDYVAYICIITIFFRAWHSLLIIQCRFKLHHLIIDDTCNVFPASHSAPCRQVAVRVGALLPRGSDGGTKQRRLRPKVQTMSNNATHTLLRHPALAHAPHSILQHASPAHAPLRLLQHPVLGQGTMEDLKKKKASSPPPPLPSHSPSTTCALMDIGNSLWITRRCVSICLWWCPTRATLDVIWLALKPPSKAMINYLLWDYFSETKTSRKW